jgi:hypothetical protein
MSEVPNLLKLDGFAESQRNAFAALVNRVREIYNIVSREKDAPGLPSAKSLLDTMEREFRLFELLSSQIQKEGNAFALEVSETTLPDRLEELDGALAQRENAFRQILTRHLWYIRRLSRFSLRKGQTDDIVAGLRSYIGEQASEKAGQAIGKWGFLSGGRNAPVQNGTMGKVVADMNRSSIRFWFAESKTLSLWLFAKYRVRYAASFVMRFVREAVVSFLIFGLLVEAYLHEIHIESFLYVAMILAAAYVADRIATAWLRKRRAKRHARNLTVAAKNLYKDYMLFARARGVAEIATVSIEVVPVV